MDLWSVSDETRAGLIRELAGGDMPARAFEAEDMDGGVFRVTLDADKPHVITTLGAGHVGRVVS